MGITQHGIGAVPGIGYGNLAGVGIVAGGAAGEQIVFVPADKMGSTLPGEGRTVADEMGGVIARYIGVIVGEVSNDGLAVYPLKKVIL